MKAIEQNIEKEIAQAVMEEQPMQPPAPKRKKRLTESTAAKVIAFLLMLVMTAVTAGGVLGAVFCTAPTSMSPARRLSSRSCFPISPGETGRRFSIS